MRLIDADALVWKIMALCRSYQKTHLVHAEMLEHFTNSVLAYIDHAEEHKTEVKVIQYDVNLSTEPCKSTDQNVADVPSGDLISRADTIEMLLSFKESRAKGVSTYDIGFVDGLSHAINMIDLVPSAEYSKLLQTTLNGDLISRQDALMELNGVCSNWQDDTKVAEIIKALPSAEKKEGEYADEIARRIATIIENEQDMRVILESADRPKYNLEFIADIVQQLGHLDSYVADTCDRPSGEWIDREDTADIFFLYKYECSVCGGKNVSNSSYCPNCGAHMR